MKKVIIFLFFTSIIIALLFGATSVPIESFIAILKGNTNSDTFTIVNYRMPRITLGILAACGLSISGVIMQCIIKNPLASPDILGVSNGGALFAMLTLIFIDDLNILYLPFYSLVGGLLVGGVLYILTLKNSSNERKLALVGISLSTLCASLVQLLIIKFPLDAPSAMVWLSGSLWGADWTKVRFLSYYLIVLLPIAFLLFAKMNILQLGDKLATSLGEDVKKLKSILLLLAILLTSVSVSYVGALGFIGLISPHITRRIFGSDHKMLIIFSPILASILIILGDTIGRIMMPPIEVPVGIITAFIGGPYLLYLMKREG